MRPAQRDGFYEACDQASKALELIPTLIPLILQQTFHKEVPLDKITIQHLFPESIYPTHGSLSTNMYFLPEVLAGRIKSLQQMKLTLQAGNSLREIAQARLSQVQTSQNYPKKFFTPAIDANIGEVSLSISNSC